MRRCLRLRFFALHCRAALVALITAFATGPLWADSTTSAIEAQSRAMERARNAVIGLRAEAIDDARSSSTLGALRVGSGVVIAGDGLVLTIGYLILEAEHVELMLDVDRTVPARVVAYDPATGFGLVQALAPLRVPAAPLGEAQTLSSDEPLMVASGGGDAAVSVARLVSRRPFSGTWEYHLDSALYTAPARADHSGAGLFNGRGELVGIGSLLVADAGLDDNTGRNTADAKRETADNVFVPIDLLKPILTELREAGVSRSSHRPWLGMNCVERDGQIRVIRVADDSPAEVAGVREGDEVLRLDGVPVQTLETLWKTLWRGESAQREVLLDIRRGKDEQTLKVYSTDRLTTLRHARGI